MKKHRRKGTKKSILMLVVLAACVGMGCAAPSVEEMMDSTVIEEVWIEEEAVALADSPAALPAEIKVSADGLLEKKNDTAVIDYSHTDQGYVMVKSTKKTGKKRKVMVKGPTTNYTYNISAGEWEVFPLSDGNGKYQITVYQNVKGTKYAAVLSLTTEVELENEFVPFLYSNQYVDYEAAPETVEKAAELIGKIEDPLEKVEVVYEYVVEHLSYDKELAANVKSGYLPVLDEVLEKEKGICFDYAALMTGMLRSQGVPCKLVVGYAGKAYHAWINVWTEEEGWVNGVIYFDGSAWHRMDPTFASSAKDSEAILEYIGDGSNYTAKYFY